MEKGTNVVQKPEKSMIFLFFHEFSTIYSNSPQEQGEQT